MLPTGYVSLSSLFTFKGAIGALVALFVAPAAVRLALADSTPPLPSRLA